MTNTLKDIIYPNHNIQLDEYEIKLINLILNIFNYRAILDEYILENKNHIQYLEIILFIIDKHNECINNEDILKYVFNKIKNIEITIQENYNEVKDIITIKINKNTTKHNKDIIDTIETLLRLKNNYNEKAFIYK